MSRNQLPLLIVGAGPTGLVLALWLAKQGTPFRIIDQAKGPGETSRAMVLHARTLEFYRQLGIADAVIERGIRMNHVRISADQKEVAHLDLGDIGKNLSAYPFALTFPQDDHEAFLIDELAQLGIEVDRQHTLTGFEQDDSGVRAFISTPSNTEQFQASWICGCDGAHSQVRKTLDLKFPGGTFPQLFYVADVQISEKFSEDLHASIASESLALRFPIRSTKAQRLIGLVPKELSEQENLTFEDIRGFVEPLLSIRVSKVNWFATYRVHHRVVDHFRVGRAFLAGDAAHIHSPAGGQGMNTGIGDAVNLAWKLTMVMADRASEKLLDTYEPERIAFARTLVKTTDAALQAVVGNKLTSRFLRSVVVPHALTFLTGFSAIRSGFFSTVSQVRINYHNSSLSEGEAGDIEAGDRLPWVSFENENRWKDGECEDNHETLNTREWQVHVYGRPSPALEADCERLSLPIRAFDCNGPAEQAGFIEDAVYLVRPDGHIAAIFKSQADAKLIAFATRWKLRFVIN